MILDFTASEKQQLEALESKYAALIDDCEAEIDRLRPGDTGPDIEAEQKAQAKRPKAPTPPEPLYVDDRGLPVYDGNAYKAYQESEAYKAYEAANRAVNDEIQRLFQEWEAAGSEEWRAARKRRFELMDELSRARRQFYNQCEQRAFSKLQGDPDKIKANAKDQIERMIINRYESAKAKQEHGDIFSISYLRVEGDSLFLDPQQTIDDSKDLLRLHYEFFRNDPKATKEIDAIVLDAIASSPYTAKRGTLWAKVNADTENIRTALPLASIRTEKPKSWITPIDKVSNVAFDGNMDGKRAITVDVSSRKSKEPIKVLLSVDFDDAAIQVVGRRALTAYDREVHDALLTLSVDGKNEYITPQMIYQAMTGNAEAKLNPKQQEIISDSLNKLMYGRLQIDASKEAKAYGYDSFKYEGPVINAEKVTATLNGTVVEVIHVLKQPALYTYASKKDQIGRLDIRLLNSPVNKNEETITLQGYLYRRILSMKGSSLRNTIVYDTVYKQLDISAKSDGALRKKKHKVRETAKKILSYWKEQGFIAGYSENYHGTECYSVTIRL